MQTGWGGGGGGVITNLWGLLFTSCKQYLYHNFAILQWSYVTCYLYSSTGIPEWIKCQVHSTELSGQTLNTEMLVRGGLLTDCVSNWYFTVYEMRKERIKIKLLTEMVMFNDFFKKAILNQLLFMCNTRMLQC